MTEHIAGTESCPLNCPKTLQSLRDYQRCIDACTVPKGGDRIFVGVFRPSQLSRAYQQAVDSMAAAQLAVMAKYGERRPGPQGPAVVGRTDMNVNGSGVDPMLYAGIADALVALAWPSEVPTFEGDGATCRPRFKFGDRVTEREYEALRSVITSIEIHLARWRHDVATPPSHQDDPKAEHATEPAVNELRCEGAGWSIRFAGQRAVIKDLKGVRMLAVLVREQGKVVHISRLDESGLSNMGGDDMVDDTGIENLRASAKRLQSQLVDQQAEGDDVGAARTQAEFEHVTRSLSSALGLGTQPRKLDSEFDAARDRVGRNLCTAIDHIRSVHPLAAEHFDNAILDRYGNSPSYAPDQHVGWTVT